MSGVRIPGAAATSLSCVLGGPFGPEVGLFVFFLMQKQLLFFHSPEPQLSDWLCGKYKAVGVGHCGHSDKGLLVVGGATLGKMTSRVQRRSPN